MKKPILLLLSLFAAFSVLAQIEVDEDSPTPSFKDRVYFGGGVGLNGGRDGYGNNYFYVALNPIVGYMVTPQFSVGTGISWQHYSYPDVDIKINQYGVSPFMRYNFGKLFTYGEYNLINTPSFYDLNKRSNYDRLLLGLGYSQPLGRRGAINAMALYDVLYNQSDRVFASPWVFRVFFSF
ncbi:MAG: hypothetical protein C0523_11345 [Cytophaga sp.]|nr:hypothetical protein [Cytophaga sp.]